MSVEAALLWTVAEDDAPAVVAETEDDAKTLEIGDEMALVGDEDKVLLLSLHTASILSGQHGSVDCWTIHEEGH